MKQVTDMKIVESLPPNYSDIDRYLGVIPDHKPVFCFGDTIHNPFERHITPDIEIHEQVHSKQQGDRPEIWWMKYLNDASFRLKQEIEAYGTQYATVKPHIHGAMRKWALEEMASALASESYGRMINYADAKRAILRYKNIV